jgi:hypothetical protein
MVKACAAMVLVLLSNGCELIVDDGARSVESTDGGKQVAEGASMTPPNAAPDAAQTADAVLAAKRADAAPPAASDAPQPRLAPADSASAQPAASCPSACAETAYACAQTCSASLVACSYQCPGWGCPKQCPKQASDCKAACMAACTSCLAAPACAMTNKDVCPMATMTMPMAPAPMPGKDDPHP